MEENDVEESENLGEERSSLEREEFSAIADGTVNGGQGMPKMASNMRLLVRYALARRRSARRLHTGAGSSRMTKEEGKKPSLPPHSPSHQSAWVVWRMLTICPFLKHSIFVVVAVVASSSEKSCSVHADHVPSCLYAAVESEAQSKEDKTGAFTCAETACTATQWRGK